MENIHAPMIPSGPTTDARANGIQNAQLSFAQLQAKKESMEGELKALGGVLDSYGVDMNTSLLTSDGFPRADLDVAQIRTTRSRIVYLRNDYKELMNLIERHIHQHFARQAENEAAEELLTNGVEPGIHIAVSSQVRPSYGVPFAKVNSVVDGSPAGLAGLKAGDEIRNFGYVNAENHDSLRRLGECVQGNIGHVILVNISRSAGLDQRRQELSINLTPQRDWGGRGSLGCHILPI